MMELSFTTKEVEEIANVKQQWLQYKIVKGYLRPKWPASGQGTVRKYSYQNLIEIMLLMNLDRFGIWAPTADLVLAEVVKSWPGYAASPIPEDLALEKQSLLFLKRDSDKSARYMVIRVEQSSEYLMSSIKDSMPVIFINLDQLKIELYQVLTEKGYL